MKLYYSYQETSMDSEGMCNLYGNFIDLSSGQDAYQVVDVGFTWYPNYLHDAIE